MNHFKHIPILLLYRWIRATYPEVNLFVFAAMMPPHRFISAQAALALVRRCIPCRPRLYHSTIPKWIYESMKLAAHEQTIKNALGQTLSDNLKLITGAVQPSSVKVPPYKGLRTFTKIQLTTHDVVAIKILSRALGVEEWELVSLLLDGTIIQRRGNHARTTTVRSREDDGMDLQGPVIQPAGMSSVQTPSSTSRETP
jgi:hypothetical protein